MTSRLDRLVTLLETGSTQLIRHTAAQQLADVQKAHPDELFNLLTRVVPFLRSKSWETRIAAAKALGGIVDHAEKFDPNGHRPCGEDASIKTPSNGSANGASTKEEVDDDNVAALSEDQLQLEKLDIAMVLKYGKKLLGSAGKEYDYALAALDPTARLALQKKNLSSRLGLAGEYMEVDLLNEGDFSVNTKDGLRLDTSIGQLSRKNSESSPAGHSTTCDSQSVMTPIDESGGMSRRQLNQLKRKNKMSAKNQANKVRIVDLSIRRSSTDVPSTPAGVDPKSAIKTESITADYFSIERKGEDDVTKVVSEFKGLAVPEKSEFQAEPEIGETEWPFERLCEFLTVDLFDHNWEIRHGAAMALREIIRVHGKGAGRRCGSTRSENDRANRRWLDDLACRLCCVFMLDRFGDYISDNVIAPIRETIGQTLGALLVHLPAHSVLSIYRILHRLVMQEDLQLPFPVWEVCHGGMIGMRYLVAVRRDLLLEETVLIDGVIQAVMKGLGDFDDDVRAVSAATLTPIAEEFVKLRRPGTIEQLMNIVWDCLSNLRDDLSASTGAVMDLLAKLCSFPDVLEAMRRNASANPEHSFALLVPRLYPFLRHTITSVRSAVLRALLTFLDIEGEGATAWVDGRVLRLVFQNLLVERQEPVLTLSLQVWKALAAFLHGEGAHRFATEFLPHLGPLMTLTVHPIGVSRHPIPMDASLFMRPSGSMYVIPSAMARKPISPAGAEPKTKRRRKVEVQVEMSQSSHNVDGHMIQGDVDLVGINVFLRSKIYAARAMGFALSLWPADAVVESCSMLLLPHLRSSFATTQITAGMIAQEYGLHSRRDTDFSQVLSGALIAIVDAEQPLAYSDLVSFTQVVRGQCQSLLNLFREAGGIPSSKIPTIAVVVQGDDGAGPTAFSIDQAEKIIGADFDRLKRALPPAQRLKTSDALNDTRGHATTALEQAKEAKALADLRIRAAEASAIITLAGLPKKAGPIIKALMDAVKKEEYLELQQRAATAVADLVRQYVASDRRGPVDKIICNLVKFCCVDTSETPEFHHNSSLQNHILSLQKEEDHKDHQDAVAFEREAKAAKVMRRGAKETLEQLAKTFGGAVLERLPMLRTLLEDPLRRTEAESDLCMNKDDARGQELVDALSMIRALTPRIDPAIHPFIIGVMPRIIRALQSKLSVIRYAAAKCFATICSVISVHGMTMLVEEVLPSISNALDLHRRQGAIECVYHLIHVMEEAILPYVIFLIVPVLGRMSDSDNDVRLIATTTFATLVKLVPLEAGIPDPPGLSAKLLEGRDRERKFMAQMLDVHKVEAFVIPVAIKAELRSYQQEGVNWLAFLNRYHLHGILCDDMGLGKTLQTLCIVASDHHNRAEEYKRTGAPEVRRLPSLIVCPPTLSGHWQQEIKTYAPFLSCLAYVGPPAERQRLRSQLGKTDVVITSYDICRNDVDTLLNFSWNYLVLDEGHLIKNARAKVTIAVKRLLSDHRLILSGTPIQNNVLELWSLFDFLMPGFLGTEKIFHDRFAKPIAASRFSKSSSREQEAGALAIEALHKQVLPFLLRRLKEEVLDDLPPKILQNYYCDLSPLQKKLFEDFSSKEGQSLATAAHSGDKQAKQHIFQALQYMRKLCNSPAMVMKEGHKHFAATQALLAREKTSLRDPIHAPKLTALRDLLIDCGIGVDPTAEGHLTTSETYVSPHRALIFCQMREMLDMVQSAVLQTMLPSVQFLRMDGSVDATKRQDIVNRFNTDPSYDVLLLTTSVGGLGLNLTGADTVIFVEHDWNPQKDLQAMDRAHRIGQKKVVNVYRIVTRGTLEEKILSLQRFKIDVASTVVNQQNAGLGTMETDQILDLFNLGETADTALDREKHAGETDDDMGVDATGEVKEKGKKGLLDDLGELWDDRQYEEEYNLDSFLHSMKG